MSELDRRYDIDKLLIMWQERIDTLEGKKIRYQDFADETMQFVIYAMLAIIELHNRTRDKA